MKTAAITRLRRKLAADLPAFGLWITLEASSITEMAVALYADWIVIDAEHGHLAWKHILALKDTIRQAGKNCGLLATSNDNLLERVQQGFRLIGVGQDTSLLLRSLRSALATVGRDHPLNPSLNPASPARPLARLERPPE